MNPRMTYSVLLDEADDGLQRDPCEILDIVFDPLLRVVGAAAKNLQPVVRALLQPQIQKALGQPAAPADLEHLAQVRAVDLEDDCREYDHSELGDQEQELVKRDEVN